jgi:hypothetical protein
MRDKLEDLGYAEAEDQHDKAILELTHFIYTLSAMMSR